MFNETLRIERIARTQGGRYYCKAENGVGVPAIKSIRVDVQCESEPPCLFWPLPGEKGAQAQARKEEWGQRAGARTDPSKEEDGRDFLSSMLERGFSAIPAMCAALYHSHSHL